MSIGLLQSSSRALESRVEAFKVEFRNNKLQYGILALGVMFAVLAGAAAVILPDRIADAFSYISSLPSSSPYVNPQPTPLH